jgi:hypothetical protein
MKITKNYLKSLIKESLEEMKGEQTPVEQVTTQMIEDAVSGMKEYVIRAKFAREIVDQHHIPFEEVTAELGDKPTYKVSELFGWLGY